MKGCGNVSQRDGDNRYIGQEEWLDEFGAEVERIYSAAGPEGGPILAAAVERFWRSAPKELDREIVGILLQERMTLKALEFNHEACVTARNRLQRADYL